MALSDSGNNLSLIALVSLMVITFCSPTTRNTSSCWPGFRVCILARNCVSVRYPISPGFFLALDTKSKYVPFSFSDSAAVSKSNCTFNSVAILSLVALMLLPPIVHVSVGFTK